MKESIEWTPSGYIIRPTRTFVIRSGVYEKITEPRYNVYDLHDNLLDTAFNMSEAIQIFKERYKYWDGSVDLFIDETDKPLRIPLEPLDFKTLISLYNKTFYNV